MSVRPHLGAIRKTSVPSARRATGRQRLGCMDARPVRAGPGKVPGTEMSSTEMSSNEMSSIGA